MNPDVFPWSVIVPALEDRARADAKRQAALTVIRLWQDRFHTWRGSNEAASWHKLKHRYTEAFTSALILRELVGAEEGARLLNAARAGRPTGHTEDQAYLYFRGVVLFGDRTADRGALTLGMVERLQLWSAIDFTTECMIEAGRTGVWACPPSYSGPP